MNWLGHVPLHVPGLPSLSWAAIIWLGLFAVGLVPVLRLAVKAIRSYAAAAGEADAEAERDFALGQLVARVCGVIMVGCGLAAGLIAAAQPPQPVRPLTGGQVAFILVFLVLAGAVVLQAVVLERTQRAAREALRRLREQSS